MKKPAKSKAKRLPAPCAVGDVLIGWETRYKVVKVDTEAQEVTLNYVGVAVRTFEQIAERYKVESNAAS